MHRKVWAKYSTQNRIEEENSKMKSTMENAKASLLGGIAKLKGVVQMDSPDDDDGGGGEGVVHMDSPDDDGGGATTTSPAAAAEPKQGNHHLLDYWGKKLKGVENAKASLLGGIAKLKGVVQMDSPDEEMAPPPPPEPKQGNHHLLDYWGKKLVVLCSASAIEMALLSAQIHSQLPAIFCFLGLTIILAFTCFFVGKCVRSNFEQAAQVFERFGIFFGVTAIFIAICVPFPLWFKCVACFIYALCWFTIFVCNYFHSYLLELLGKKKPPKENILPISSR